MASADDITQGLPRVVELFEARQPKGRSPITEAAGRITIDETDRAKKILVTHGTGFNWFEPDHFRLVTLPDVDTLTEAIGRIGDHLATLR